MNVRKAIVFGDAHRVPSPVDLLTCASPERAFSSVFDGFLNRNVMRQKLYSSLRLLLL